MQVTHHVVWLCMQCTSFCTMMRQTNCKQIADNADRGRVVFELVLVWRRLSMLSWARRGNACWRR